MDFRPLGERRPPHPTPPPPQLNCYGWSRWKLWTRLWMETTLFTVKEEKEVLKSVSKCEAGLIYTTYISCYTTPHHVSEHAMDTTSVQLYSYISFCLFISLFRWDNEGLHTVLISLLAQTFLKDLLHMISVFISYIVCGYSHTTWSNMNLPSCSH